MSLQVSGVRVSGASESCELCEPCSKKGTRTNATIYCESCDEFQCDECSKVHQLYNIMENHTLVKASEHKRHLVGLNMCDDHKQDIRFFCEEDDQLCCATCAFLEHRSCTTVQDIEIYSREASQSTDTLIGSICDMQDTAMLCKNGIEEQTKDLQSHVERVLARIDELQSKVDEIFENMPQNISKEGKDVSEKAKSDMTDRQKDCKTMYSELEDLLNIVDKLLNRSSLENMFIAQQKLTDIHNMYSAKLKDIALNISNFKFEMIFEEKMFDNKNSEKDLANLRVLATRRPKLETLPWVLTFESVALIELKKKENDEDVPFYSGMVFLIDRRLIAADNKNSKLVIFDQKLDEIGEYKPHETPFDVSSCKEDEIVVIYLGGYFVDLFFVTNVNTIVPLRTIGTASTFCYICQESDTSFIVGCYKENRFVKSLSLKGEEKCFDIDKPTKCVTLESFSCTYIRKLNKIVIVEKDKKRVLLVDAKTKEKVIISGNQITEPKCSAIGPFDCVLVISKTGDIVQISQSGQVLATRKTGIMFPQAICVSKDKKTFVVSSCYTENYSITRGYLNLFKLNF